MAPKKRGAKAKAEPAKKPETETKAEDTPQEEPTAEPTEDNAPKDNEEKPTEAPKEVDAPEATEPEQPAADEKKDDAKDAKPAKPAASKKRKAAAPAKEEPRKGSRASKRSTARATPEPAKLLSYLLSPAAATLTQPDDETEALSANKSLRAYSTTPLNSFEELLCAVVLSRPISHRLGMRTIRTVLNAPYNFNGAKVLQDAGSEKRLQALWDAKTQHKDKTASQMGTLADVVLGEFTADGDKEGKLMAKLLQEGEKGDMDGAAEALRKHVKGLGTTGLEIFFRRVQWLWPAAYPNVDGRTADALRMLGLPQDGQELVDLLEGSWKKVDGKAKGELAGEGEAAKKRRAFVVVLERATGAQLEDKIDDVLAAAAE